MGHDRGTRTVALLDILPFLGWLSVKSDLDYLESSMFNKGGGVGHDRGARTVGLLDIPSSWDGCQFKSDLDNLEWFLNSNELLWELSGKFKLLKDSVNN
ncbi:hypothetical protein CEXT_814311 [Caerostris extrusa]|uniref:Uncharacterized protein n=1 Tax=Caerostris extrusa TaxID=172846 RepID=A0AAV4QW08_CAEEX|nr:hypothetical protein CEXT_814311 [Caerostris extrusa]